MLPLPMTAQQCADEVIAPAFRLLLPSRFDSRDARVMLLAMALQESGLGARKQLGGPAMGLWQFEQGGGVRGVLNHPASRWYVRAVCLLRFVAPTESDLYHALSHDDVLAAAIARLLLWTDPEPLSSEPRAALACYLRTWRPGAYQRDPEGVTERFLRNFEIARRVYA